MSKGNIRLVGGSNEQQGVVELHLGGDEWISLSYYGGGGYQSITSDWVCVYLGYPHSIGATEVTVHGVNQTLCSFNQCPIYGVAGESKSLFECMDDFSLKLCPDTWDQLNNTLLGVVCATGET